MKAYRILLFLLLIGLLVPACQLGRFVWYNFSNITDYRIFPSRQLSASEKPFTFYKNHNKQLRIDSFWYAGKAVDFDQFMRKNKTVAFLVLRNDTIVTERYYSGYDSASIIASFSMAKSYISALIGCAIHDGLIQNVNDPITRYIPEMSKNGFDAVSIEHLLQMTSGIDFNESYYNPFGHAAAFYYGKNLDKKTMKLKLKWKPGTQFEYTSGSTQLLGLVLKRALKQETITAYFERKLWKPMQMEFDASWSLDERDGMEKAFCCLNARARDFAKFGRLYLNNGNWNGQQLVPADWVAKSTVADTQNGGVRYYKYQWWLDDEDTNQYCAQGHLGQYIFIDKAKKVIVVRLGSGYGNAHWPKIASMFASQL
ncbi:MAG: beta-lactamase family protein [Bacteroidia bacterium]|nr:beta-lactamase family protein [Bacteroidia bacterium]